MSKRGHIPLRTCVGCKRQFPKKELLRFTRSPEGELLFDERQRLPGRGGYLCRNPACFQEALRRNAFSRPLRAPLRIDKERIEREFSACLMPKK